IAAGCCAAVKRPGHPLPAPVVCRHSDLRSPSPPPCRQGRKCGCPLPTPPGRARKIILIRQKPVKLGKSLRRAELASYLIPAPAFTQAGFRARTFRPPVILRRFGPRETDSVFSDGNCIKFQPRKRPKTG